MAVQATPPIQLDPSMDQGHQLTFINQNFQSIANVLNKISFLIVAQDTISITKAINTTIGSTTVTHNLGYQPAVIAFFASGGGYTPFPFTRAEISGTNSGKVYDYSDIFVDTSTLILRYLTPDYAGNTAYTSAVTLSVKYYLLQITAN